MDFSFLDLGKSKEKEESVGRDHAGSSLGDKDTKLEGDNQCSGVGVEARRPSDLCDTANYDPFSDKNWVTHFPPSGF
jgi:hypothetical protein